MTHVNLVITGSVLSNRNEHRLMVRRRVDARKFVDTSRQSTRHSHTNRAIDSSTVNTLKERKLRGIRGRRLRQAAQLFDHHVGMSDDVPLRVDLLRSGVIVRRRVHEVAELEVLDVHDDVKVGVRGDGAKVGRVGELRGGDVGAGGDDTHGGGVARTGGDLLAVGDREVGCGAEVDKVVAGGQGGDLAGCGVCLAILFEPGCDDGRVKGCRQRVD